ncbi:MAG TPA: histidine kinase dimerization/phospho-acceptor domain-containing protein [Candidatus Acidoferrales bacterium]|nr:histidine kinase dimerization/phospho-acceptor domain-containing protein [Candidatus Acidoferrales bacterium]
MPKGEQTILLVTDDTALCQEARKKLEVRREGVRVAAVRSLDAAWRIVEDAAPAVILLEETSMKLEPSTSSNPAPELQTAVRSLAGYAPVVVIGPAEHREELSALLDAGAADYVERGAACLPEALNCVERRLTEAGELSRNAPDVLTRMSLRAEEDFGEVLRHELNNPLTGILGNAELLLAEIRRKGDGRLPQGGQQRVETIAALAVRLRETVRRLSQEWEARRVATL